MRSILLVIVALLGSQLAIADPQADINYRQGVMTSVGGHMKAIATIMRGGVYPDDFGFHAHALADLTKIVPHIFPEGSGNGKTEALPAIWEKPDEFKQALQKFVDGANDLAAAADSGDKAQMGAAVQNLGKACKNCHDNFREEHEHED